MLWIGGQITALGIVEALFLASAINIIIPLLLISRQMRGRSFETRKDIDASLPLRQLLSGTLCFSWVLEYLS